MINFTPLIIAKIPYFELHFLRIFVKCTHIMIIKKCIFLCYIQKYWISPFDALLPQSNYLYLYFSLNVNIKYDERYSRQKCEIILMLLNFVHFFNVAKVILGKFKALILSVSFFVIILIFFLFALSAYSVINLSVVIVEER